MREIVLLGSRQWVHDSSEAIGHAIESVARSLGLEGDWRAAADPFFFPAASGKAAMQWLTKAKLEYHCETARVCPRQRQSPRHILRPTFQITAADGEPVHSACVAMGLDRWSHARGLSATSSAPRHDRTGDSHDLRRLSVSCGDAAVESRSRHRLGRHRPASRSSRHGTVACGSATPRSSNRSSRYSRAVRWKCCGTMPVRPRYSASSCTSPTSTFTCSTNTSSVSISTRSRTTRSWRFERRNATLRYDDGTRLLTRYMMSEHLAAFHFMKDAKLAPDPVLRHILKLVGHDEFRHTQFAYDLIAARIARDPSAARRLLRLRIPFSTSASKCCLRCRSRRRTSSRRSSP